MAEFSEEELNKALTGGDGDQAPTGIAADLMEEETPKEPETPQEPAEEQEQVAEQGEESETEEPKPEEPTEPAEKPAEPEPAEEPAPEEPKLILGKFKSQEDLEKAYQNLEKRFGEKAKEVKEVEQVKSDDFDNAVREKIAEENWKLVDKAFDTITKPEDAKEAQYLLMQFRKTGDGAYLEKARGFLDARVDRKLEVDAMNMAAKITQEANAHREEILLKPLSEELDKMVEEDPEFMNDEQNQNLMAMAIKLNPTTVDVRYVKKAIKEYRELSYKKGYEAAKREFAKQAEKKAVSVKSVAKVATPAPKKDPANMTIKEQLEEEYKDLL